MVLSRKLAKSSLETLLIYIRRNRQDLVKVGRHRTRRVDEVVQEIREHDEGKRECILFPESSLGCGCRDKGEAMESSEEVSGEKIGDDGPANEAQ